MSQLDKDAFEEWVAYRAASKHGPLSEVGVSRLIKRMERLGSLQRAAVESSMAKGYEGVFPPAGRPKAQEDERMKEDDSRLAQVMKAWALVHRNVTVTSSMVVAYRQALKGMTHEQFERAVSYLDKNAKWFPKPAEMWQAARTEGWM